MPTTETEEKLIATSYLSDWRDLTQQGFARLLGMAMNGDYIWIENRHCWAHYNGIRWVLESPRSQLSEQFLAQRVAEEISLVPTEDWDDKDLMGKYRQFKAKVKTNAMQTGALDMARPHVSISSANFNDLDFIAFPGGVIELPDLKRREPRREDWITKTLSITPDSSKDCPHWKQFIDDTACHDPELILYFQCLAGYAMTPWLNEPAMFNCYGSGRNGKTTMFSILSAMLGTYATHIDKDAVIKSTYSRQDWSLPRLEGARLAIVAETSKNEIMDEGKIKACTGNDTIEVQVKFGDPYNIKPQAKWIIYTNNALKVQSGDMGIWRRVVQVPFKYQVPDDKLIPPEILIPTLMNELPAIAAWALEGLRIYIANGHAMSQCKAVFDCTQDYRATEDIVMRFLMARGAKPIHQELKTLHAEFRAWHEEETDSQRCMGKRAFREELRHHGIETFPDKRGTIWIEGEETKPQPQLINSNYKGNNDDDIPF